MVKPLVSASEFLSSSATLHGTVGVLTPQSVAKSFRQGLEAILPDTVSLRFETIDTNYYSLQEKVGHLLDDDVDYLIGLVSQTYAQRLQLAPGRFMAVNLGEDVVNNALYHDLGLWQASWALGTWAAQQGGSRAVVISSIYDSGYDALDAFHQGFRAAGGEVAAIHFTDTPDFASLKQTYQPDVIYAAYNGQTLDRIHGVQVISSPFTRIPGSVTAQTWEGDAFYALGYETGSKMLNPQSIQAHPVYLMRDGRLIDELSPVPGAFIRSHMAISDSKVGWIHPFLPR